MSLEQKAKDLAAAIKETEEFETLKSAENRLNLDPTAQDLLQNFQNKQQELQEAQQQGQQIEQEEIQSIQGMQQQMQSNETIKNLMDAQQKFDQVLQEVNQTVLSELQ
ncbi:YlbF family regulator [Natranaerobius trueperi]|uniref:YlbF family regulator n=1 Tax=Natranaerobius trueperi TaxID=759412 RepID=UPI00130333E9|nr:YlbF family regulator [Natranaerobius trueperi]